MLNFFLSPKGRINRWQFWQGTFAQLVFLAPLLFSLSRAAGSRLPDTTILWAGLETAGLLWTGFCLSSKRLHDRGKSEWFFLLVFIPLGAVWHFIECGLLRGEAGPNAYGSAPGQEFGQAAAQAYSALDGAGPGPAGAAVKLISRARAATPAKTLGSAPARQFKAARPMPEAGIAPVAASSADFPERKPSVAPIFGWRR